MEKMRVFWDAAVEFDADAAGLNEAMRFPLCPPEALGDPFTGAGSSGVEVTAIDVATHSATLDDYWRPFLGGPVALDESARARLRGRIRVRRPLQADGSILLVARARAARTTLADRAMPDPAMRSPSR